MGTAGPGIVMLHGPVARLDREEDKVVIAICCEVEEQKAEQFKDHWPLWTVAIVSAARRWLRHEDRRGHPSVEKASVFHGHRDDIEQGRTCGMQIAVASGKGGTGKTTVATNLAFVAEHGMSFWIELGGKRILFDTGQGNVLSANARRLGIRLEQIDAIAISHGHYDHTGGLGDALQNSRVTTVYAHPAAFEPKFARNPDGTAREIGMPSLDERMVREMAELVWVQKPTEVGEGLRLTGPVPRTSSFEDTGGAFFKDHACTEPDPLVDDQAAFLETPAGTVVILGCAHAGVINTLLYVQTLTDNRSIHTVIGGMHLLNVSPERMDRTMAELRRLDVQRLLPCHCTGFAAMARLWNEFPERCVACPVGTVVEVPG